MKAKLIISPALTLILFLSTACTQPTAVPNQAPDATSNPVSTEQVEVLPEPTPITSIVVEATVESTTPVSSDNAVAFENSLCTNPYYPVRYGSTWNYQSTGSSIPSFSFTETITAIYDGGFTLTSESNGTSHTQEWACTPDGLVALQMGGGAIIKGMNLNVDTLNASGVILPAKINPGDTWQYKLDFTGTMDVAGLSGSATGSSQSDFTSLGFESITIPAGTFNAMKVQVVTTFDANVNLQGFITPVKLTSTGISWYAEGTGLVKSESNGDFAGQSFSEMIEMQWYNLP